MFSALFVAALLCVASAASRQTIVKAPLLAADSETAIPNEYIVRLNPEITDEQVEAHLARVNQLLNNSTTDASKIMRIYHIGSFRGYAVRMDDQSLEKLRELRDLKYVERNQEVHALGTCLNQEDAEWGLCRTTVRDWPIADYDYSYDSDMSGEGVDAYVIDTGIYLENVDFEGRAIWGTDEVDSPSPKTDLNGHGTHVAGTVGGKTYGIAKKATIIAVRVLNAAGSGTYAQIIGGVNWVADQHTAKSKQNTQKKVRSVANMSLGGSKSTSLNDAVESAFKKGVVMVFAAGNEGQNACNVSPASAQGVTVAASDSSDIFASFSNYGSCVDIIAPGVRIKAPYIGGPTNTAILSGTSMAAPHVAGVLAKYLSGLSDSAPDPSYTDIQNYFRATATKDKIVNTPTRWRATLNWLIFMDCL